MSQPSKRPQDPGRENPSKTPPDPGDESDSEPQSDPFVTSPTDPALRRRPERQAPVRHNP